MFKVIEVFKNDGQKFVRFESNDKFECEVWIAHFQYEIPAVLNGRSELIIEEN